jgi:hypothetical protein
MTAPLTEEERAALLRVRYAGRYDLPSWSATDEEERKAEQWAMHIPVDKATYLALTERGFIAGWPMRLTDAGREALARAQ